MITIQSVMLVALGFLLATLIALALAPAYRARAMRLTYRHIRRTIPLTESEVRVDRDRLRAQYAVRIHDLETKLEKARLAAARQQVEVNRRDAGISALESELAQLRSDLEQNVNARRVLEQTVMDRIPMLERRLADTRSLLQERDRELAAVTSDTGKSVRALDEVMQINAQQRAEIERLNSLVATRSVRNRNETGSKRFESEVALRTELESLRARARDQESLIARLQSVISAPPQPDGLARANGTGVVHDQDDVDRLRRDLAEAEAALKSVGEQSATAQAEDEALTAKLYSLEAKIADQAATVRKLEAALATYEQGDSAGRSISLKDSKIAMKARIAALQTEVEDRTATVHKLRAELASVNERLARQSAQFMEEMRRLRTGTTTGTGQGRRQPATDTARRSLAERIGEANPALAPSIKPPPLNRFGADRSTTSATGESNGAAAATPVVKSADPALRANGALPPPLKDEDTASRTAENEEATRAGKLDTDPQTRGRLLERIASLNKT